MSDCVFCKISAGEIPSATIYQDENTYAFLDANPVNMGHTLVVPRDHYENFYDTPKDVVCGVMEIAQKLSTAIKDGVDADGINIHINNDPAAGQKVFHFHVHVIPRFKDDGFEHWHGDRDYREGEKEELVEKIQTEL